MKISQIRIGLIFMNIYNPIFALSINEVGFDRSVNLAVVHMGNYSWCLFVYIYMCILQAHLRTSPMLFSTWSHANYEEVAG